MKNEEGNQQPTILFFFMQWYCTIQYMISCYYFSKLKKKNIYITHMDTCNK